MKLSKKDFFLFASPFLVFLLFFLLQSINNALILREEQAWLKPRIIQNTDLIERPQPDGSVKTFERDTTGKETLLFHAPPRPRTSKGLFKLQDLVLFAAALILLSAIISAVHIMGIYRRRRVKTSP